MTFGSGMHIIKKLRESRNVLSFKLGIAKTSAKFMQLCSSGDDEDALPIEIRVN